jgi:hypothetical protein
MSYLRSLDRQRPESVDRAGICHSNSAARRLPSKFNSPEFATEPLLSFQQERTDAGKTRCDYVRRIRKVPGKAVSAD